jgi:REP element-mobilizing transposase RayT
MANRDAASSRPTAAIVQGAVQPRFVDVRIRERGRLPHWEKDSGLYFITFRLADSLPEPVLEKIAERHRILMAAKRVGARLLPSQELLVAGFSPAKLEEYFDRGAGACWLRDPHIGELMADGLRYWNGKRYWLVAWCVMPNHVHVVCRLLPGQSLSKVLQGWKSFTAKKANEILGRSGAFWQREYYDRLIRDGDELERAVRYVVRNPEKAGLKGWRWVWSAGGEVDWKAGEDARRTADLEIGATGSGTGATSSGTGATSSEAGAT